MQATAFCAVIPPRARTGILSRHAWRNASRPAGRRGAGNFGWRVTGDANGYAGEGARATLSPNLSDFSGGNVVSAQMHAVGATGEGNVCAGVY